MGPPKNLEPAPPAPLGPWALALLDELEQRAQLYLARGAGREYHALRLARRIVYRALVAAPIDIDVSDLGGPSGWSTTT